MPITTADGWFGAAKQRIKWTKTSAITTVAALPFSMWAATGDPGAGTLAVGNTTTGVLFEDTTAGAPLVNAFGGGATGYLATAQWRNSVVGGAILFDRIWGAGAVSMTTLASTNFASQPAITGRLPGGNDWGSLEIWLEITTTVSATATTISVTYTNEAGTGSRSTGATNSLSGVTTPRLIRMPLQAGDKGVQKIDSVTVGGTVATTGAFNVLLLRRLAEFDIRVANAADSQAWDMTGATQVFDTSCLMVASQADGTSSGVPVLNLTVLNG